MNLKPELHNRVEVSQYPVASTSSIVSVPSPAGLQRHLQLPEFLENGRSSGGQLYTQHFKSVGQDIFYDSSSNGPGQSLVITNSGFSKEKQTLGGVLFKNEMCLGLPPNVTWEELSNEKLLDPFYLRNLFECTRELNRELKRKRTVMSQKAETVPKQASGKSSQILALSAPGKETIALNRKDLNKLSTIETGNIQKITKQVAKSAEPERSYDENPKNSSERRKHSVFELVKLRNSSPINENIINKLKTSKCDVSTVKMDASRNNQELTSNDIELAKVLDNRVKLLLQDSWLDVNDEIDASNSKEIYENLLTTIPNGDLGLNLSKNNSESCEIIKKKKKKKTTTSCTEELKTSNTPPKIETEDLPFESYYDREMIDKGLSNKTLIKDTLRINPKNTKEAYIHCLVDNKDIFIAGIKDRNRALEGDEVIIELHPKEKWKKSSDDSIQKCGKVVAIAEYVHPRTVVGYLKIVYGKSCGIIIWPRDNRLPRVRVSEKTCPPNFRNLHKRYKSCLFLAKITSWKSVKSAEGHVLRMLGEDDSIDVESESILIDNNLDMKPLTNEEELVAQFSDNIPSIEINKREDIRKSCVFTIDPPTAKDLDDAVSYRELPNGNCEVGVHIADVSHYVKPDTPIDEDIRKKATSVYLVTKVYHMLPSKLCQICSLLPGADKLAFSVFIELDENGEVVSHRFSKTILRSCAQFCYDHVQQIIDNKNVEVDYESFPTVSNDYSVKDCADIMWKLHKLADKIRTRRFEDGALKLDQPKILFELNKDGMPTSYSLYKGKECNWLIEEFMLMANILTAKQTYKSFPCTSILRYHAAPKANTLISLSEFLEKVGVFIDVTNAGTIYKSMRQYDNGNEIGESRMAVIMNLLVKPMMRANYVCSTSNFENGSDCGHYALNIPLYTHFTSPMRRYADIVVHRLLAASIGLEVPPTWNPEIVQRITANCNLKSKAAKKASEMSAEFFLKLYLQMNGSIQSRGVVIDVKEKFLEVIDLSTRIVGRCYLDKTKNADHIEFQNDRVGITTISITWNGQSGPEPIHIFTVVSIELSYNKNTDKNLNHSPIITLIGSGEKNYR